MSSSDKRAQAIYPWSISLAIRIKEFPAYLAAPSNDLERGKKRDIRTFYPSRKQQNAKHPKQQPSQSIAWRARSGEPQYHIHPPSHGILHSLYAGLHRAQIHTQYLPRPNPPLSIYQTTKPKHPSSYNSPFRSSHPPILTQRSPSSKSSLPSPHPSLPRTVEQIMPR